MVNDVHSKEKTHTLPKTNSSPLKIGNPKRKLRLVSGSRVPCVRTLRTYHHLQEDTPLPWQLAMVRGIAGSDLTVKFPGGKAPRGETQTYVTQMDLKW